MSAALAAAAGLAGCSGGVKAGSGASAHAATSGSVSMTPAAAAIADTQLTGTQLTAALLNTASDLPIPGFAVTSKTDSGGSLTTAKAKFALSTLSCADQQNDLGVPGFGETAMSSNAMLNAANKDVVSQIVYQFADPNAAHDFFATLKARWNSCGTFTVTGQDTDAKLTVTVATAKAGVGQQDFANTMTGTINGTTYALASTVALDGPDVLIVGASKVGSTVSADIDTGGLLAKLIRKIAAAA